MNLSTTYLGLKLKNPLVASSSTMWNDVTAIRQVEDAGAAAVVLPSVFQEEIDHEIEEVDRLLAETGSEALSYLPTAMAGQAGPEGYLELMRRAREAVDIPVIASLNGTGTGLGWVDYARRIEQAGAAAIELNIYFLPTDLVPSGVEVECRHLDIVSSVKAAVDIPVAVKLSPYFSSVGHIVRELDRVGADGFVLFNRFYQPDIDLEELKPIRDLRLSHRGEIRLPLLWIAALHGKVKGSLAASTGVQTAAEVVKYLFAGADVVCTTSALIRHGPGYLKVLLDGLVADLVAREANSVADIRGKLSRGRVEDRQSFDRANYMKIIRSGVTLDER